MTASSNVPPVSRARQVLDAIDARTLADSALAWQDHAAMSAALRAVLNRHVKHPPSHGLDGEWCAADGEDWPCPDVRDIESAFGGAL